MTFKYSCCDDGSGTPVGTILKFESVTILIDPSWNASKISYKDAVLFWSKIINEIDLIIISEPTVDSLGAYALIYYNFLSHFVSRIEVYATLPIANLGRLATIDYYVNRGIVGPYTSNEMDLDDIERAFEFIKTLKYSQLVDLKYKFDGLTLVAFNSGSSPGGTIWCISSYVEKIVYAKRWNHTKGTILNGANILDNSGKPISALTRPSAVITTFDKFGLSTPFKRRNRELKELLKNDLKLNKTVVIPVEVTTNFLELFVIIHDMIYSSNKTSRPLNTPVLFVSYSRGRALTYAKSMLEWLTASLLKNWNGKDNQTPFNMGRSFHIINIDEIDKFTGPKICLVSNVDSLLSEVIEKLNLSDKLNVILTERNYNKKSNSPLDDDPNTADILSQFYAKWNEISSIKKSLREGDSIPFNETIKLSHFRFEDLTKEESEAFKSKITQRRQQNKETLESLRKEANKLSEKFRHLNGDSSINGGNDTLVNDNIEDDDDDDDDIFLNVNRNGGGNKDIEIPVDIYVNERSRYKMFPFNPKKEKPDDYGTMVDFTQFIPKDDGDEDDDEEDGGLEVEDEDMDKEMPTKKNSKKRSQSETVGDSDIFSGDDDDDDVNGYVISNIPVKKSRRGRLPKGSHKDGDSEENTPSVSYDNMDYLDPLNHPTKRTIESIKIKLNISLTHFNLENLVDQRSATVIWPLLKFRKMILLGPPDLQNESVIMNLNKKNIDIIKTKFNDTMEMDTSIKTMDISIDTALDQMLNWQKIGDDHTVAHVIGRLVKETMKDNNGVKLPDSRSSHLRSKLVLKPLDRPTLFHSNGSLSIGDVRLAELKRKLTDMSHVAEFRGEGMLVIDDQVAVRKISDGETIIDGSPSEIFDTVKLLVTEMLAKI